MKYRKAPGDKRNVRRIQCQECGEICLTESVRRKNFRKYGRQLYYVLQLKGKAKENNLGIHRQISLLSACVQCLPVH